MSWQTFLIRHSPKPASEAIGEAVRPRVRAWRAMEPWPPSLVVTAASHAPLPGERLGAHVRGALRPASEMMDRWVHPAVSSDPLSAPGPRPLRITARSGGATPSRRADGPSCAPGCSQRSTLLAAIGDRALQRLKELIPPPKHRDVADGIGMTADAFSRVLSGKRQFSSIELARLADQIDADLHWLITGELDPHRVSIAARHDFNRETGQRTIPGRGGDEKTSGI